MVERRFVKRRNAVVAAFEDQTERIARVGVALVDRLRAQPTADRLDEIQDYVRMGLMIVEERISSLRWRVKGGRRSSRLRARFGHRPDFPQLLEEARELADRLETALRRHAAMLRMIADSAAWVALREDPRRIVPLFAPHTHALPDGIGHAGPLAVLETVHADGRFLALQCDLTRCLGVGDIVVLPAPGRESEIGPHAYWANPLALEIKSSGRAEEGALAQLQIITPVSGVSPDAVLYKAVTAVLGTTDAPPAAALHRPPDARVKRQESELIQSAELLKHLNEPGLHAALERSDIHWATVDRIVRRASGPAGQPSFDIPEPGLAFVAAPVGREGDVGALRTTLQRLQELGFPRGSPHLSLGHLLEADEISAYVPPIPLWQISEGSRIALLSGVVQLAAIFADSLWKDAWRDAGLRYEDDEGWWIIDMEIGDRFVGVRLDPVEVRRLRYGVAYGGISPRATAAAVLRFIRSKATGDGDSDIG
jgi:hypothetical protein